MIEQCGARWPENPELACIRPAGHRGGHSYNEIQSGASPMQTQAAAEAHAIEHAIEKRVPLLALDIDGTVREGKDDPLGRFVNGPEDVRVFPEAVEQMRRWKRNGGRIIGVSNQGGIALGLVSYAKVAAAMSETYRQADKLFDKLAWCQHHPNADAPEMAFCWCRKPSPGLLIEAALDLAHHYDEMYPPHMGLFVGDRPEDEECARLAGFPFQWAADWRAAA